MNFPFIKRRLASLEKTPMMWAFTREGFAVQLCMLLELYNDDAALGYMPTLFANGNIASGLESPVDNDWAKIAIAEAKKRMPALFPVPVSESEKDVHTEHCCVYCGCKYADENCPVENNVKGQSHPCEIAGDPY